MYQALKNKKSKLAVIGLGYVGLPMALHFAKKFSVIGYDIDAAHIKLLQQGIDCNKEFDEKDFDNCDIQFTSDITILSTANFYIVAVPSPVDEYKIPNLSALQLASETIGKIIKHGDYVVFESTVFPGCTEEICIPGIELLSNLKSGTDFKFGYSPERINPGDKQNTFASITKIVSGCDKESLEEIAKIYDAVIDAGVHKAASVKIAEAAKVIENIQRDVNIALMNELSMIFDKIGINTYEVLEAAATKWNFLKFQPGLVGGHCIGVDPYYLTHKSKELGYESKFILAGRAINDAMAGYVAKKILQHIIHNNGNVKEAKVLVMGATFKENVSDTRNSKVADMIKELRSYSLNVDVTDPYASSENLKEEYGFELTENPGVEYDAVIITVPHDAYKKITDAEFASITKPNAIIADIKGIYRGKISSRIYWSF